MQHRHVERVCTLVLSSYRARYSLAGKELRHRAEQVKKLAEKELCSLAIIGARNNGN